MALILQEDSFAVLLEDGTSQLLQEDGVDPVAMNPTVRATFKPATVVRTLNA
jgi:hypothetical protein